MNALTKGLLKIVFTVLLLITVLSISNVLSQEHYPNRPIVTVVGYPPGTIDTMTRALCRAAEKELGQPIVVDNKPGAAGGIAMNYVLKSKPDGYTLGTTTTTTYIMVPHMQEVPFDVLTDVTDIMVFCKYNQILCVRADAPWNTYEEMIDYSRKNPGKFTYGQVFGTATHICMERIARKEKIKWTQIPFKGSSEYITAVLGGHINAMTGSSLETSDHIKAGKLKPLLILTDSRLSIFPDVPTILEKGYGFDATTRMSVVGPKDLAEDIRQKLENAFKNAMSDQSFIELAKRFHLGIAYMSGKEYSAFWRSKYKEFGEVIKEIGLGKK